MSKPNKLAYSVIEAAEAADVGRTTLYGAIGTGDLRAVKCGRRTLILADDLHTWLKTLRAIERPKAAAHELSQPQCDHRAGAKRARSKDKEQCRKFVRDACRASAVCCRSSAGPRNSAATCRAGHVGSSANTSASPPDTRTPLPTRTESEVEHELVRRPNLVQHGRDERAIETRGQAA